LLYPCNKQQFIDYSPSKKAYRFKEITRSKGQRVDLGAPGKEVMKTSNRELISNVLDKVTE